MAWGKCWCQREWWLNTGYLPSALLFFITLTTDDTDITATLTMLHNTYLSTHCIHIALGKCTIMFFVFVCICAYLTNGISQRFVTGRDCKKIIWLGAGMNHSVLLNIKTHCNRHKYIVKVFCSLRCRRTWDTQVVRNRTVLWIWLNAPSWILANLEVCLWLSDCLFFSFLVKPLFSDVTIFPHLRNYLCDYSVTITNDIFLTADQDSVIVSKHEQYQDP